MSRRALSNRLTRGWAPVVPTHLFRLASILARGVLRQPLSLLWLLLLLAPAGANALSSDRTQPIYISADHVTIDEKTGLSRYQGDVELVQGTLRVQADSLVVHRREEALEKVIAEGNPSRFSQRPDGSEEDIRGEAKRLEYRAIEQMVILAGGAYIRQGLDEFRGEHIVYNAARGTVQAKGGEGPEGRVRAVIHPPPKEQKQ